MHRSQLNRRIRFLLLLIAILSGLGDLFVYLVSYMLDYIEENGTSVLSSVIGETSSLMVLVNDNGINGKGF